MVPMMIAAGLGAAGTIGASLIGGRAARRQQQAGINAANEAEARYRADIDRGIAESGEFYDQGQNFLAGMRQRGDRNADLLDDITGLNGPEAQQNALAMYRNNPSAALLGTAREDAIRRTLGSAAASGLSGSGSAAMALARRTGDMDLQDFYGWQANPRQMAGAGMQANALAAQLATQRGGQIMGARSSLGQAGAGASLMRGNAQIAGIGAQGQAMGAGIGQLGQIGQNALGQWWNQGNKPATGGQNPAWAMNNDI